MKFKWEPRLLPGESWAPIEAFPGYDVSNLGRIRAVHSEPFAPPILSTAKRKYGYRYAMLRAWESAGGKRRTVGRGVHRLVAAAFVPNPDNKTEIDHINGDASDNRAENLRWVTRRENMHAAFARRGNWLLACKKPTSKVIRIDIRDGSEHAFASLVAAARDYGARCEANGSAPKHIPTVTANICHATKSGRQAYDSLWVTPGRRLALGIARAKVAELRAAG